MPRTSISTIRLRDFVGVFALIVASQTVVAAGPARIEVHPFETADLPTPSLLRNDFDAARSSPVRTIAGELRLPLVAAAKVPAVVFLHGDAGALWNQPRWIDDLNAMGIAVFTVDSFAGRGLVAKTSRVDSFDGPLPGLGSRLTDAYRALDVLARHPQIDPTRIALMGVSSGGRATIASAMQRFSRRLARSDARYVAYVALYPPCGVRLVDEQRVEAGPLRIFIGGADNITGAASCERFAARLRKAGVDIETTVYPGAFHGFDNPAGTPQTRRDDVPGYANCELEERAGAVVNVDTGAPLADSDRCIGPGFSAGRDAAGDVAVREAVARLFDRVLAPGR